MLLLTPRLPTEELPMVTSKALAAPRLEKLNMAGPSKMTELSLANALVGGLSEFMRSVELVTTSAPPLWTKRLSWTRNGTFMPWFSKSVLNELLGALISRLETDNVLEAARLSMVTTF